MRVAIFQRILISNVSSLVNVIQFDFTSGFSDILVFQDAVDEFARASRDLTKTFSSVSSLLNFIQFDYTTDFLTF